MTDLKEQIAIALWHRFAPEWHVDWSEEEYQAEYRDAADAVLLLAQPSAAPVSPALTANGVCLNCGTDESFGCDCNEVAGVQPPAAPVETLNEQAREHPRYDNPRDPFAAPQRSSAAPVEGEGWLHLKAKRVLSVDRGQTTVLCDRDIPTELLVLVDVSDAREDVLEAQGTIEQLEKQLAFERKKSEPNFLHAGSTEPS